MSELVLEQWSKINGEQRTSDTVDDVELGSLGALREPVDPGPRSNTLLELDDVLAGDFAVGPLDDLERRWGSKSGTREGQGQEGGEGVEETHLGSSARSRGEEVYWGCRY